MGYGSRALKALNAYYSGENLNVDEDTRVEPEYPFPGKVGKVGRVLYREVFFLTI
jgi:N-acetyltransferase 10